MAPVSSDDAPLIILANFASPTALDLRELAPVRKWAEQAPREIWLARPGDVLITPMALSEPFTRYACQALGIPRESVHTVTVRDEPGAATAEIVHRDGLFERLREYAAGHPGTRLLPIVLDEPTFALAAGLGTPVTLFGRGAPVVGPEALPVVSLHNTKAGFREVAEELGMRLPHGTVCGGADLPRTVRSLLERHRKVVVKPDRSAGGHGLRFVSRDGPRPGPEAADSRWIVEEHVAHTASVSAQFAATPGGPRFLFDGEMRTVDGSFNGYRSPPSGGIRDRARGELRTWGLALGGHLAEHGYFGPYGIDAIMADDGVLYATESNVRRTATTTPQAMVGRLSAPGDHPAPAWLMGATAPAEGLSFPRALELLTAEGLAYDAERGEGVVLYADRPPAGGAWRYVAVAPGPRRLAEVEAALTAVFPRGRAPVAAERSLGFG